MLTECQSRKQLFHIRTGLFLREILAYHILNTNFNQIVHIIVSICSVGITPLTIVLVERTIVIVSDNIIIFKLLPTLDYWKKYDELSDNGQFEEFKKKLINEINELNVDGMPKVEKLNALVGKYVNLEYRLLHKCK